MPRKLKRAALALTPESERQMDGLCKRFGETRSEVMKRALQALHWLTFETIIAIKEKQT